MHAVIFDVEHNTAYEGDADAELDGIVEASKADPGFVSGSWLSDGTNALAILTYETEDQARSIADGAEIPPGASVILRGTKVWQVVRTA